MTNRGWRDANPPHIRTPGTGGRACPSTTTVQGCYITRRREPGTGHVAQRGGEPCTSTLHGTRAAGRARPVTTSWEGCHAPPHGTAHDEKRSSRAGSRNKEEQTEGTLRDGACKHQVTMLREGWKGRCLDDKATGTSLNDHQGGCQAPRLNRPRWRGGRVGLWVASGRF